MVDLLDSIARKVLRNPGDAYLTLRTVNQAYYRTFKQPGQLDVMTEDWDTLLLLDACRYDYFRDRSTLAGTLESRRSPASMSYGFMKESFFNRQLHDTVYVTANPFATELPAETFHDVISLVDEYYENDVGTVPPETIRKKTLEAHDTYPNKRIISHFMQPHEPFLSDFGRDVSENLAWMGNQYRPSRGQTVEDLRRAYGENVDIVLREIAQLVTSIDGRTVVSADHGELLGERLYPVPIRGFEHPESIYTEELLRVPWLVIDGERRNTQADPPESSGEIASEAARSRLRKLGYI